MDANAVSFWPERRRCALGWAVLAAGLVGCGGSDPEAWGMLHGHLSADGDAVHGYAVWEFYAPEWGRRGGEDRHQCARVLELSGDAVDVDVLANCPECTHVWELSVADVDHDCRDSAGTAPALAAMTHFALAPRLPADKGIGEHPASQLSALWSWDGASASPAGVVWDESLDHGSPSSNPDRWTDGRRYVLWPGDVWRLKGSALANRAVADTGSSD